MEIIEVLWGQLPLDGWAGVAAAAGIVVVVLGLLFSRRGGSFPYELRGELFTPAERGFYRVLAKAVGSEFAIFGKVRIADVIQPRRGLAGKHRQIAFNRIAQKHFDFVLCNPRTLTVMAVIELDDRSHERKDRKLRDAFVDKAMSAAGLEVIHFQVRREYSSREVRQAVLRSAIMSQRKQSPDAQTIMVPGLSG